MSDARVANATVRLSALLAPLSYGLDLCEGQRPGHAIRSCLIAMRLGAALSLPAETGAAVYYTLLLKDAGGPSAAAALADLFDCDDHTVKRDLGAAVVAGRWTFARIAMRHAAANRPGWTRLRRAATIAAAGGRAIQTVARARGELGAAVASRLSLPEETVAALRSLDEHWNGRGHPDGRRGSAIPLPARIARLAQAADILHTSHGLDTVFRVTGRGRGTWFDPDLVDALLACRDDLDWWHGLMHDDVTRHVAAAEPRDCIRYLDERGVDGVAEAFAEIIDAKTPYTRGNSLETAGWAATIAREHGVGPAVERRIYRAALLRDIGTLGISTHTLAKPGPLTPAEHKAIERHTVNTWEILSRSTPLRDLASIAALHHERLDGSGYPNGLDGRRLDLPVRILAVADVYVALVHRRAYRKGLPPQVALALLRGEADDGRFDREVVAALARSIEERPAPAVPAV